MSVLWRTEVFGLISLRLIKCVYNQVKSISITYQTVAIEYPLTAQIAAETVVWAHSHLNMIILM